MGPFKSAFLYILDKFLAVQLLGHKVVLSKKKKKFLMDKPIFPALFTDKSIFPPINCSATSVL